MTANPDEKQAVVYIHDNVLRCEGHWTSAFISELSNHLSALVIPQNPQVVIDTSKITKLDSAGLWLLQQIAERIQKDAHCEVEISGLSASKQALFDRIKQMKFSKKTPEKEFWITTLGKNVVQTRYFIVDFLSFLGEVSVHAWHWLRKPALIRFNAILSSIFKAGCQAMPIIALLSFLIGVVLAYQLGDQLKSYGANIFIVDLLGLTLLREFAPLITAIIVAGRSGASFAAQLGSMKLNEELDVLKTLGIPPTEILVLPKIVGLTVALPLLTILSICFSLFGGMIMARFMLEITFADFVSRFGEVVRLKSLLLGAVKTPVFAVSIATISCFQGFLVTNSAESVGQRTTISVVQSLFMIIMIDAIFSILYNILGL